MLLTCPTCRSGLQVPDGTTAQVRCPACKTVFSSTAESAPPPTETKPRPKPAPRPADDEEDRPRKKLAPVKEKEKPENRDFDPEDPDDKRRKKKRRRDDGMLSEEEKLELRRAFERAAWGCKLVWISLALFLLSMVLIIAYYFQAAFAEADPVFITIAGAVGGLNWLLAAAGVTLCLSGPKSPGHWGYGIAAAVAIGIHLILLLILVSQGKEYSVGRTADPNGPGRQWGLVPTRLDAVTFYMTILFIRDQDLVPRTDMNLSIVVGVVELVRTMLIVMLLSRLARAAGDDELSGKCTRAAGIACFGPAVLSVGMLVFILVLTEAKGSGSGFTKILLVTMQMGVYAVVSGTVFPALMVAREAADACEEPYKSKTQYL